VPNFAAFAASSSAKRENQVENDAGNEETQACDWLKKALNE
jgi:hypothetical protein